MRPERLDLDGYKGSIEGRELELLRSDHRAPIELLGVGEGDLAGRRGRQDVGVRGQLDRGDAGVEGDLDLLPDRVEPVALDRVKDGDEVQSGRLARVTLVDDVEGRVLVQVRLEKLEVDGEQLPIVI